jgi:hypothetical protein
LLLRVMNELWQALSSRQSYGRRIVSSPMRTL